MNRHLHYQEFEPGDHTKYHTVYAVAAPGIGRLAHWGNDSSAMLFGFNVKSKALRSAILPIGEDQRCDYWTFVAAMDWDTSEAVASHTELYTMALAYIVYRHLSGVMGTETSELPAQPRLGDRWEALLK